MINTAQTCLLEKLANLNTWVRAGQRAPHKPLYLLLCVGRLQAGLPRLAHFSEIQEKLKNALQIFGPSRKSYHAEYPFWHLAQDKDSVCEIVSTTAISLRPGSSNPSSNELVRTVALGGLRESYFSALKELEFASIATHRIVDAHFPPLLHTDILDFFEIKLDDPHSNDDSETWKFRKRVLDAYEGICCITGMKTSFKSTAPGLESIHICWPQAGGNDEESNGILMNTFHAKLFVLGMIGITKDFELLVSPHMETNRAIEKFSQLTRIRLPNVRAHWPSQSGLEWHRSQVFKA
jgi:putative restriction endonuclease